ncbi:N-acetyltransferase family protein [Microbacterium sp. 179-B 1A2 NHS]|uniref:GNAT family N-acetyltransferase n=1 Tax=Microbacterium sp. 179-B 1A2 NHS TaxID=3142383 RepID=UPI0039A1214D
MTSTAVRAQFELRPLVIPTQIDGDDAADFIAMTEVRNIIYREISGNDDEALSPSQLLAHFAPSPDELRIAWVIAVEGAVVGRMIVDLPQESGSRVAYWLIELLESVQGQGIGSALYPTIEDTARAHGRSVLESWAEHPEAPGPRLEPPTGFGSIPHDRYARFYLRHGYTLEQVDRKSVLALDAASVPAAELLVVAEDHSPGYRIAQWTLPTPPEHRDGYAEVKSRMSTDAPAAGLEYDEEAWDAARVSRNDARYLEAGQTVLVTVAIAADSGRIVAFNELCSGRDEQAATQQLDTLVLKEHRGHRLGQRVKCAGILRWREMMPLSPRILTFNAEENRPMLDINEAIGFVPAAYIGAWKRTLT